MRLKLTAVLLIIFFISALHGENDVANSCDAPETLVPLSANMLMEIPNIAKTLNYFNSNPDFIIINDLFFNLADFYNAIFNRPDINLLDQDKLKKIGINIYGKMYIISNNDQTAKKKFFTFRL